MAIAGFEVKEIKTHTDTEFECVYLGKFIQIATDEGFGRPFNENLIRFQIVITDEISFDQELCNYYDLKGMDRAIRKAINIVNSRSDSQGNLRRNIKILRAIHGCSSKEVSEKTGIEYSLLCKIESGYMNASLNHIVSLAKFYEETIDNILLKKIIHAWQESS